MRSLQPKQLWKEFREFYILLWHKSWKLTIFLSIAIPVSLYDEIRHFSEGGGTLFSLWEIVKAIIPLF